MFRDFKNLNEAEILSIKRLRAKGISLNKIAERIGVKVSVIELVLKKTE